MLCHLVDASCCKLKFNFNDLKKLKFRGVDLRLRQISNPFFLLISRTYLYAKGNSLVFFFCHTTFFFLI